MAEANDGVDSAAKSAIGEELRRARDTLGWTRAELATRLPFDIHVQTLAGYERGTVQCTIVRFVELCQVMGVSAPDMLAWAMQRAEVDLPTTGVQIDLRLVVDDWTVELVPLRRWAFRRLENDRGGDGIAHVAWPVVQEMATLFGFDQDEFVTCLIRFTPRPKPRQR
jgi:transcriptional regulator with XRE-family HTH domain